MKNIQKFMICSNIFAPSDHRTVYKIDPDSSVRLVEYKPVIDLFQPSEKEYALPLPREISYMIIDRLILKYIQECNFELAMQMICIDKPTIVRFYFQHLVSDYWIPFKIMFHRLSKMFELMQKVYDGVVQFPNEEHDHYVALDIQFRGNYRQGQAYNPWNFTGMVNIIQIPKPGIFGVEDFRGFVTGPYITDIVWMNGRNDRGITYSDFFRLPVIVFVFTDQDENIIPERRVMENHHAFKTFAKFLKMAFGPTTGIFFAVQGHFIFDDQILVEL
jgi:hypothetical protein